MKRRLVVNADDFGFTRGVNAGIVEAHRKGILTAATLMANGAAFDDAVRLARENPSLDVGCHLVLVQGPSVASGNPLPATLPSLLRAIALGRAKIYEELAAQIGRIEGTGIRPTHLDTHKHTHLLPPVLDAVARLSEEHRIPWVRRPFDFPIEADGIPASKRMVSWGLGCLRPRFHRVLARRGCRSADHFAGFRITGRYGADELVRLIEQLPEGITEFMCHPGHCTDELRAAPTRLKESRQTELDALTAPETRAALQDHGVQLTSYRELGGFNE